MRLRSAIVEATAGSPQDLDAIEAEVQKEVEDAVKQAMAAESPFPQEALQDVWA